MKADQITWKAIVYYKDETKEIFQRIKSQALFEKFLRQHIKTKPMRKFTYEKE